MHNLVRRAISQHASRGQLRAVFLNSRITTTTGSPITYIRELEIMPLFFHNTAATMLRGPLGYMGIAFTLRDRLKALCSG